MNKSKWIILGAVGVFLAAGVVAGAWWFFYDEEPPPILSEDQIADEEAMATAKFMASEDFGKLSDGQQQKYLDVIFTNHQKRRDLWALRDQLNEDEKKQLRKNMRHAFRTRLKQHIDEYHELPPDEREGYLDNLIDMMQEMRDETPPEDRRGGRGHARRRGGGSSERRKARTKKWLETTSPRDRAKMAQFMMGMMARARARGIQMGPR